MCFDVTETWSPPGSRGRTPASRAAAGLGPRRPSCYGDGEAEPPGSAPAVWRRELLCRETITGKQICSNKASPDAQQRVSFGCPSHEQPRSKRSLTSTPPPRATLSASSSGCNLVINEIHQPKTPGGP